MKSKKKSRSSTSLKQQILWISLLGFFPGLVVLQIIDEPMPFREVRGTVIGLHQPPSRGESDTQYVIRLEDGRSVHIPQPLLETVKMQSVVTLQEYKTRIFRRSTFRFLGLAALTGKRLYQVAPPDREKLCWTKRTLGSAAGELYVVCEYIEGLVKWNGLNCFSKKQHFTE